MANDYMAKLAADLDGMTMGGLASKGRYGDTMIAHINPQEAEMLMEEGGSGTINPMTGLPEFYDMGFGSYSDAEESAAADAAEAAADQAMADAADAAEDQEFGETFTAIQDAARIAELDQEDQEFGDTFRGFSDDALGGDKFTLEPAKRESVQDFIERANKEGLNKEESVLYTELLNSGLIGSEALAKMGELLGTPGVAQAMSSGFSDGYRYGGMLEDVLGAREDALSILSSQIKSSQKKQDKEAEEDQEQFFDDYTVYDKETSIFDDILGGVKDFFGGPSEKDELGMDMAVRDAGFTFDPMSDAEKYGGMALSYLAPNPIGFVKGIGDALAFATDSRVLGNVNTPYGTFQLTESGDLQTTDFMGTGDIGGTEPSITKKRKVATEKTDDEEDKEEEVDKPYFPRNPLPFTPSEEQTLTNIFGPDSYLLNQTGLRTLV